MSQMSQIRSVGQDGVLLAAYNMGHGSASTVSARIDLSSEERAAAM